MHLDRRKFTTWLSSKKPDEIVGHNRDCHGCPLALFYADTGGCEVTISDTGDGYYIDRGGYNRRLPRWASRFAFNVDGETDKRITARRALEIMEIWS